MRKDPKIKRKKWLCSPSWEEYQLVSHLNPIETSYESYDIKIYQMTTEFCDFSGTFLLLPSSGAGGWRQRNCRCTSWPFYGVEEAADHGHRKKIPRTKCATKNGKCARKCKDMYRHISKYPIYIIYIYIYINIEIYRIFKKYQKDSKRLTDWVRSCWLWCPKQHTSSARDLSSPKLLVGSGKDFWVHGC